MTTTLLDYAVGNTLLALPVALIAWWIGRTQRYPSVTHLLWALVLVRLLFQRDIVVQVFLRSIPRT